MIISNSSSIQSSNPLGSISNGRVNSELRSSNVDPENEQAQKAQQQQSDSIVRQLRSRDREVRAHEGAHVAAGGALVRGGPSYTFQTGPDGRSYAIGGEVQIDASAVAGDPAATLIKSGQIRAAALAPANPSSQDLRVASNASQLAARARVDIATLRREETQLGDNSDDSQQSVESVAGTDESNADAGNVGGSGADPSTTVNSAAPTSAAETSNLPSNDAPVAAISAFMASAKTVTSPVLFNQFA